MIPKYDFPAKVFTNRRYDIPRIPLPPKIINNANQPSSLRKVLGKSNPDAVIIPRPQPIPSTDSMYPKQGIFRHEKKGLAYEAISGKIINGPIMPLASSDFAFLDNKLGQPK